MSFYFYDHNPSGFCFLVQIGTFVIETSLGFSNLNMKEKTKRILVVSKMSPSCKSPVSKHIIFMWPIKNYI